MSRFKQVVNVSVHVLYWVVVVSSAVYESVKGLVN